MLPDVQVEWVERQERITLERELDRLARRVDRLTALSAHEEPNRDKKKPKPLDKDDAKPASRRSRSSGTRARRKS